MSVAASPPLHMAPPDPFELPPLDPDDPGAQGQGAGKPAGKPAGNAPRSFLFDNDPVPGGKPTLAGSPPAASKPAAGKPVPAPSSPRSAAAAPAPRPGAPFSLRLPGGGGTFAWRCGVIYAVLFLLPLLCDLLPWQPVGKATKSADVSIVAWLAQRIGLTIAQPVNQTEGSGDTSFHWFRLACTVFAALLVGAAWHLLRWNRRPGPRARDALRTFVRCVLGALMIDYGMAKVIPLQFGVIDADTLASRWGDASPMGVVWTFHALSPPYTMFLGLAELTAGMLLLWRSTTLLGALLTAAAMAQVAMLNFCYDVPVKILSTHMFAFAVLLCVRDVPRLFDLFVRNRPVAAAELWPWWPGRMARVPLRVVQLLLVAWLVYLPLQRDLKDLQDRNAPQPAHAGTWQVETFTRDGVEVAPFTAPTRWTRVGFAQGFCGVTATDGTVQTFVVEVDSARGTMKLSGRAGPERQAPPPFEMKFTMPDDTHLELDGRQDGATLRVRCLRLQLTDFFLGQRGFHWINESPLNQR